MVNSHTQEDEDTPLHLAAAWCSPFAAGLAFFRSLWALAEASSFRSIRNKYDETPLHRAAAANNGDIVKFLVGRRSPHVEVADRCECEHGRRRWRRSAACSEPPGQPPRRGSTPRKRRRAHVPHIQPGPNSTRPRGRRRPHGLLRTAAEGMRSCSVNVGLQPDPAYRCFMPVYRQRTGHMATRVV